MKTGLDRIVTEQDWPAIASVIVVTNGVPPVLASGLTYAHFDFSGRELQDFADEKLEGLAINAIATGAGEGAFIFSWLRSEVAPTHLAGSLLALPQDELPSAAVRFVAEHIENHYVAPKWWHNLALPARKLFLEHVNSGNVPFQPHAHQWFDPTVVLDLGIAFKNVIT